MMTSLPDPDREASAADATPWQGAHVIDCHFHERPTDAGLIAHLDGAGMSSALVLSFGDFSARAARLAQTAPGRIAGWARGAQLVPNTTAVEAPSDEAFDMTDPSPSSDDAHVVDVLFALKADGWRGFAETAGPVEIDGPELQRTYARAAELDVPVMMHFQESAAPGQPAYGIRGFSRIEAMLKKYPDTRFVCHAPDFWGGIDSRYEDGGAYLLDRVSPGGLSDRLLADYENMYGDLGAPSALLQLTRDLEFTAGFLERHRDKLMFGSDCGCGDGRGGAPDGPAWPTAPSASQTAGTPADAKRIDAKAAAAMQTAMASLGGLAGKCIARELLSVVWKTTSRGSFAQLVAANAIRIYNLA